MEATENKIEATYREAWISVLRLSVEFIFNDVKLEAMGNYYNGHGIDDIEVRTDEDHWVYFEDGDAEYEAGKNLLEEMDLNKYLTF